MVSAYLLGCPYVDLSLKLSVVMISLVLVLPGSISALHISSPASCAVWYQTQPHFLSHLCQS